MIFRIICLILAVLILLSASLHERYTGALIAKIRTCMERSSINSGTYDAGGEDDILDNKKKWRILIVGYCIFIILLILSAISIFTLNSKINSLAVTTQELQKQVLELENK